ncbi:MAG TPA: hypothetical protein VHY37_05495 [Tepidisphaeraceae bacterium]|jgi:hypothetical protein|nr:hypothetical protein [Tepidisphaeraceae bacterium]
MTDSRRHSTAKAKDPALPAPALPTPRPFHPHRKLFLLIGAMLFIWLAVLLVLYFTTVYPYRHSRVEYPGEHLRTTR